MFGTEAHSSTKDVAHKPYRQKALERIQEIAENSDDFIAKADNS